MSYLMQLLELDKAFADEIIAAPDDYVDGLHERAKEFLKELEDLEKKAADIVKRYQF